MKQTEQKPKHFKQKKKTEFSKKWLIACVVISLLFTTASYILAFLDKNTVENLSIQIIQLMWGMDGVCFLGYVFQNSMRAWSINKFGKSEVENDTGYDKEIIDNEDGDGNGI